MIGCNDPDATSCILVTHHWFDSDGKCWKVSICNWYNLHLGRIFRHKYPSWELQKEELRSRLGSICETVDAISDPTLVTNPWTYPYTHHNGEDRKYLVTILGIKFSVSAKSRHLAKRLASEEYRKRLISGEDLPYPTKSLIKLASAYVEVSDESYPKSEYTTDLPMSGSIRIYNRCQRFLDEERDNPALGAWRARIRERSRGYRNRLRK